MIAGLISLRQIHAVLDQRLRPPRAAICIGAASFLAGFGIYLGRFLRWNSWDILTRPLQLAADITDRFLNPMSHPRTWAVTVLFGVTILLLHTFSRATWRLRDAA